MHKSQKQKLTNQGKQKLHNSNPWETTKSEEDTLVALDLELLEQVVGGRRGNTVPGGGGPD